MFMTKKAHTPIKSILAALALATAITAASTPASAATGFNDSTVQLVEYSTGHLLLQLTGVASNFHSFTAGTCAVPLDTVKMFETLTQASLLSGRTVRIYWDDCGTANKHVTVIDLNK